MLDGAIIITRKVLGKDTEVLVLKAGKRKALEEFTIITEKEATFARDCSKKRYKSNYGDGGNRPNIFPANCVRDEEVADHITHEEALFTSDTDVKFDWIL